MNYLNLNPNPYTSSTTPPSKPETNKSKPYNLPPLGSTLSLFLTLPLNPNKPRNTPRPLLRLLGRKPQHLHLRRKPLAQRLRMKRSIRRKPPSKRAFEVLVFENGIVWRLVLDVHFVERGVFLRRGADCYLYWLANLTQTQTPYI